MPQKSKGPRLWLRPERRGDDGKLISNEVYVILDGGKQKSTGCAGDAFEEAQQQLAEYIANKYEPERREKALGKILIADVLLIFDTDKGDGQANQKTYKGSLLRLNRWWGDMTLAEVTGRNCRAYMNWRIEEYRKAHKGVEVERGKGGARRDLQVLAAAINHHQREGLHRDDVLVWLPPAGLPKDRFLTRSEAARLLWWCWRKRKEYVVPRGPHKGQKRDSGLYTHRHVARFILLGLYTGTRAAAIAAASPVKSEGKAWVDLQAGVYYRLAVGKRASMKRQPPVKLQPHVLSYLKRWAKPVKLANGNEAVPSHFITWMGEPVKSVKTAFAYATEAVGLEGVTPHTLRHTAATWMIQNGTDLATVAEYLGMSEAILRSTYWHHHPDYQGDIAKAFRPRKKAKPLEKPLEDLE